MNEITFNSDCEICGRKNVECRNHHLVPQRLLNILPFKRKERFMYMKLRICNSCQSFVHPENKLYEKIRVLEGMIARLNNKAKFPEDTIDNQQGKNQEIRGA